MRKSQIALGERWKWHFQVSRFQIFLGELYYPCYGTDPTDKLLLKQPSNILGESVREIPVIGYLGKILLFR